MAVRTWSAEALAEYRSLEHAVPRSLAARIRPLAQEIAAGAGRTQVERLDVCEALGRLYGKELDTGDGEDEPETA
jgi:histone H3/H4